MTYKLKIMGEDIGTRDIIAKNKNEIIQILSNHIGNQIGSYVFIDGEEI